MNHAPTRDRVPVVPRLPAALGCDREPAGYLPTVREGVRCPATPAQRVDPAEAETELIDPDNDEWLRIAEGMELGNVVEVLREGMRWID